MGPIARIIARYTFGFLAAWGIISSGLAEQLSSDPDVQDIFTSLLVHAEVWLPILGGMIVETFYTLAKRLGWAT